MNIIYPSCRNTFRQWCSSNGKYQKIYNKIGNPIPFDVTLRDGLQGLSKADQESIKAIDKITLYYEIKEKYQPLNMEIGSIVSKKVLPIFYDSETLYNYVEYNQLEPVERKINNFILIPNEKQFENINKFIGLNCFSFITSVSESFQQKNTNMSLETSFEQLNDMMRILDDKPYKNTIKLYISCINECPIEGKLENDYVINQILKFQKLNPDILCLSDTCGSLTEMNLKIILNSLSEVLTSKQFKNISLHLHVKPGREEEVEKIIHKALDYGICNFDVSSLKSGGCSVTMDSSQLFPNLTYDLYYKSLANYILKNV